MKKVLLTISLSVLLNASDGQILSDTSTVFLQIKAYLGKLNRDTSRMPQIFYTNLLDTSRNNFGVFFFRPLTSVDKPLLFLRNYGETKIEVIQDYNIDSVYNKTKIFFDRNSPFISYSQKVSCTRKIMELLENRLK